MQFKKTLNETFPKNVEDVEEVEDDQEVDNSRLSPPDFKQRALSAKSHIFRKGKIESKYGLFFVKFQ